MRVSQFLAVVAALAASCADDVSNAGATLGPVGPQVGSLSGGAGFDEAALEEGLGEIARWRGPAPTIQDYGPYQITLGNGTYAYLERVAVAAEASTLLVSGSGGQVITYSLFVDETQAVELFSLLVPDTPASVRRPLLTAFHGFGTSHRDIESRTSFFHEARSRDWYLIAPLQRSLADPTGHNFDIHFSSPQSQMHVQAVISFVMDHYLIDKDRIYGVGFSMGGGGAMSYAARNRSRRLGAFAAVVNHTGTVALGDVYANLPFGSPVIDIMELIFGGKPSLIPFEWQRSSLIEVDAQAMLLPNGEHMAVNLAHVPTQTWYNASDSLGYLVEQSLQLDGYLQSLPGANHELVSVATSHDPDCATTQHCWGSLDQAQACDWLEQHSLNAFPASGSILADRDGRWEYFELRQAQSGRFSRLSYEVDVPGNSMTLSAPANLASLGMSLANVSLDAGSAIKLNLMGFDGSSTLVVIEDVPTPPLSVIRDGNTLAEDCAGQTSMVSTWCHDPVLGTLTLVEAEQAAASWRIEF